MAAVLAEKKRYHNWNDKKPITSSVILLAQYVKYFLDKDSEYEIVIV